MLTSILIPFPNIIKNLLQKITPQSGIKLGGKILILEMKTILKTCDRSAIFISKFIVARYLFVMFLAVLEGGKINVITRLKFFFKRRKLLQFLLDFF